MICKAAARGKGRDFARYLEHSPKNEQARILDIYGTANPRSLADSLAEMSAYERLTRSDKGILQVIVNPAEHEPIQGDADWRLCVKTIAEQIGYTGQPYAAVLHTFEGKEHMHIAFQRYEFETGRMKGADHVGLNLKQARLDLEIKLKHEHLLSWQERKAQAEQELKADLTTKREAAEKERQQQNEKLRQREKMAQMLENGKAVENQPKKSVFDLAEEELDRTYKLRR